MRTTSISAVFDAREKAEEAITRLSQLGLKDVFIKTSPYLPDFTPSGIAGLSIFSGDVHSFSITTVTGSIPESRVEEAGRIIRMFGGMT